MTPSYSNNPKKKKKNRFFERYSNSNSNSKDTIVVLVYILQEKKDIYFGALADGSFTGKVIATATFEDRRTTSFLKISRIAVQERYSILLKNQLYRVPDASFSIFRLKYKHIKHIFKYIWPFRGHQELKD